MSLHKSWLITKLFFESWRRNFQGPFFAFGFPLMVLLIMGEIQRVQWGPTPTPNQYETFLTTIMGIVGLSAASVTITSMPMNLLGFKESIIIKRIAITPIRKIDFILAPVILGFLITIASAIWIIALSLVFFNYQIIESFKHLEHVKGTTAIPVTYGAGAIFSMLTGFLLVIIVGMSIGLFCASFTKTQQSGIGICMMIYFPSILLSGAGLPMPLITKSPILNVVSYFMPTRYFLEILNISILYGGDGIFTNAHINDITYVPSSNPFVTAGSIYPDNMPAWALIPINVGIAALFMGLTYKLWKW
ncbi:MAG: ABC transporter permease [Mycoplasma sp.]